MITNISIEKKQNGKYNYLMSWTCDNRIYTQFVRTIKDALEYVAQWENINIIYKWR